MRLSDNTILITGGTGGIGLELATQLLARRNTVIITGRDQPKLDRIKAEHPSLYTIQSDVSDPRAIASLYELVTDAFPALNILINNAGIMRKINLQDTSSDLHDISREIETDLVGPVRMVSQFLPHLKAQWTAAIVNVSSGLAFTPFPLSAIYSAAKAGVHSFTQSLRVQLKNTRVRVFELAPPSRQTPLNNVFDPADMKGSPMMDVKRLVRQAMKGLTCRPSSDQRLVENGVRSRRLQLVRKTAAGQSSGCSQAMLSNGSSGKPVNDRRTSGVV
jgi:uncharacterized oxidoreductase